MDDLVPRLLELPGGERIAWYHRAGREAGILLVGGYARNPLQAPLTAVALACCRQWDIDFTFLEFRGQGRSSGELHQLTLPAMIDDIRHIHAALPRAPRIGAGASLGGWALLAAARGLPFESLLLLSPAVDWDLEFVQPQLDDGRATEDARGLITMAGGGVTLSREFLATAAAGRIDAGTGQLPKTIRLLHGHHDDTVDRRRMTRLAEELSGACDVSLRVLPADNHQMTKLRSTASQRAFQQEASVLLQSPSTAATVRNASTPRHANEQDDMETRPHLVLSLFGRCGSLFLHSLFDGHPQLSTIPGIAPYATLSWFVRDGQAIKGRDALADQVSQRFCATFNDAFLRQDAGLDRLGDNADESLQLSPEDFRRHLAERLPEGQCGVAALSAAMHDAFDLSFDRQPRERIFLELHTILPGDSAAIHAGLPGARSLLLVRDPVDNIESCVNYLLSRTPVQRNRLTKFYQLVLGMLAFQSSQPFLGEDAVALRFEDVKRAPEATLRLLCDRFGLDFAPSLLESTYMGKRYHSAPTRRNPGISGFQQTSQAPSGYRLTEHDRRFFAALFAGITDHMRYDAPPRATAAEVQAVLTRRALDVEVVFAQAIGLDLATLGSQQDLVGFRQQLAGLVSPSGSIASGLRCTPLAPAGRPDGEGA